MFLLKVLPQVIAWIAALWGIWTGDEKKRHIKIVASIIASVALVVSIVLTVIDAREVARKEKIQDMFLFANTPVQKIDVTWSFNDIDPEIMKAFEKGEERETNFWENFDWTDTPDGLMQKSFHVEYIVQPIINALSSGSQEYPYLGTKEIKGDGTLYWDYTSPQEYMILFPMNVSLTGILELGRPTTQEYRDSFEETHDVVPYPAPKYGYDAKAVKTEKGFSLLFSQSGTSENNRTLTAPSLYGFNIVVPDQQNKGHSYFLPGSHKNLYKNIAIDRDGDGKWHEKSELILILNNITERPLNFKVSYRGRYVHAPRYTDEDSPHGEYTFSIFRATYNGN